MALFACVCALAGHPSRADDFQSRFRETYSSPLTVKREAVFEFAQKPVVTRQGDRVTIAFETKGFCDVTVAVQDADEKIVWHLASGVLGPNAPEPFQRNTKRQTLVWDGKNDKGDYIDDKDRLTVRVSLGLKPRLQRTLWWEPKKRWSEWHLPVAAAPGGAGAVAAGKRLRR